jgi:alkylation response protein AidB-like acyl-CoA dehydrogenase
VDIHVPGCPPRPEALLNGLNKLQDKIKGNPRPGWRTRYNAHGTEEWARELGTVTPETMDAYAAAREIAEAARETDWTRPSFAKELYLGRFDLELIHPHPRPSPEDAARGEEFLAKLQAYCESLDGGRIEREDKVPDEYVQGFADLGCFGLKIPEEYGGLGLSMSYYGKALMLAGSVHPTIGALLSAHQSIGVPEPVKTFGTEEQKRRFLPRCAEGAVTAFLLTEPDVGSDPARMASTATPTDEATRTCSTGSSSGPPTA